MTEQGTDLLSKLISGELALCQWPGCTNTFTPATGGRANRRYCGEADCARHARAPKIKRAHRYQAVADIRAELREIDVGLPPVEVVQDKIRALGKALKDPRVSEEDLRVTAAQLGAAAALVAATVEACGRAGLASGQAPPTGAAASPSSTPAGESPANGHGRTPAQTEAARAMLEAASG